MAGALLLGNVRAAEAPGPKTRVTYSEAYGKTAAQPELSTNDMPRFTAVEAEKASTTFQVRPGFRLELAAAEPDVVSPVTLAFDEDNRMYVVEMIDYSERREETPHAGRIRRLEDRDGDGRYETSTIFAEDLPWPTAVTCWKGGIFVGATPDILWLKDTNGDGRADERRVVVTGFGSGAARLNVQALMNSFNWGLDNRIHGATGPIGAQQVETREGTDSKPRDLRGLDFHFDPLNFRLEPEAGGGQYGLSFDSQGRKYVCSNSDHLQLLVFDLRYANRNPAFPMPNPRISIATDGPAAEVFRISPDEPWRIIRTRWRISGVVPGMVEGGGRVSGYFTGATGATIYRGDAYGPDFVDNAFIGDAGGNLVHRKVIEPDGFALKARRPSDEQGVEFIASKDTWFRPVHFQNAPDGCLYIADMYREVIEHPWSIPEAIKKHIDLNSGNTRGRIWRVVPDSFKRPAPVRLSGRTSEQLVALLENPNGWTRETVSRLLYERQDRAAIPALTALVQRGRTALGRMHALYALEGLGELNAETHVIPALSDTDALVREHAVRLAESLLEKQRSVAALETALVRLAGDSALRVRGQLAFTLGAVRSPERIAALSEVARRDAADPWVQAAVLSALHDGAGPVFVRLTKDPAFARSESGKQCLERLCAIIGTQNRTAETVDVLATLSRANGQGMAAGCARSLLEGAGRAGESARTALLQSEALQQIVAQADQVARNEAAPESDRLEAVQLLGQTRGSTATLNGLLETKSESLHAAVIGILGRINAPELAGMLVDRWKSFSPRSRSESVGVLASRTDRALALLKAVESGRVPAADVPTATANTLRGSKDPAVSALAAALYPPEPSPESVLAKLQPVLGLQGNASAGRTVYIERCASCHRAGPDGVALGPDFVTVKTAGKEKLLTSLVNPNAEVAPQYIAFQVETREDDAYTAIIANETTSHVTLRMGNGQSLTLPRAKVRGMKSSGQSLMPEGLTAGLSPQAVADLLEFVATAPAPVSAK